MYFFNGVRNGLNCSDLVLEMKQVLTTHSGLTLEFFQPDSLRGLTVRTLAWRRGRISVVIIHSSQLNEKSFTIKNVDINCDNMSNKGIQTN